MKLVRNRAECANCGDIIESRHRHEFVSCKCMQECNKLHKKVNKQFTDMFGEGWEQDYWSEYLNAVDKVGNTGIFIDGGLDYIRRGYGREEDFIDLSEWEEENGSGI